MASDALETLSGCYINNPTLVAQLKAMGFKTGKKGMTFEEAMICSQIANAVKGDLKAFSALRVDSKSESSPLEEYLANALEGAVEPITEATDGKNESTGRSTVKRTGNSKEPEQGSSKGEGTQGRTKGRRKQKKES